MMKKNNFISELRNAFSNLRHPSEEKLLRVDAFDDSDIEFLYSKKGSWEGISSDDLSENHECIHFLSIDGLKYVTPKFLLLLDEDHSLCSEWVDSFERVMFSKIKEKKFFSEEQKKIILQILKQFRKRHPEFEL